MDTKLGELVCDVVNWWIFSLVTRLSRSRKKIMDMYKCRQYVHLILADEDKFAKLPN